MLISGNTTMEHLLQGLPCRTLGVAPYTPVDISLHEYENMTILPGISTFVGADIVSGIVACGMDESEEICILVDLGTNGEMAIGNRDRILSASTAAGPAFEGGNITCGTASIPGSISRVKIFNRKPVIGTIGKIMPPVGLCGSGLISAIAEFLKERIIDVQGNLQHPFQKDGFSLWTFSSGEKISLYQEDVRQFQMAKSAVRSGIEILRQEYGCQLEDVKKVYVAGGFGTNLTVEDIIYSGLLPEEWKEKIEFLGNTSLLGCIKAGMMRYGTKEEESCCLKEKQKHVLNHVKTISLANNEEFQQIYINNLNFD
jgi:uncharacterized 2Fe-2S/4Fe-4S cluster protein (DUF4445 family)